MSTGFFNAPVNSVAARDEPLDPVELMGLVEKVYQQPKPQPIITTRAVKQKALRWRSARYMVLLGRGLSEEEAFRQADREAMGHFVGNVFIA